MGRVGDDGLPFYVDSTKNIQQRLYNNHLIGPLLNAKLKKYLIDKKICINKDDAKEYIKKNCSVTWIYEDDYRKRGALNGYIKGMLFPLFGIYEEH